MTTYQTGSERLMGVHLNETLCMDITGCWDERGFHMKFLAVFNFY